MDKRRQEDHLSRLPDLGDWGKEHSTGRVGHTNNFPRVMSTVAELFNKHFCMPRRTFVSFAYAKGWSEHVMPVIFEMFGQKSLSARALSAAVN